MKQLFFGCSVMLMTQWACTEKSAPQGNCDCPEVRPCTFDLRSVTVHVVDERGNPVQLDGVRTIRSSTKKEIRNQVIGAENYRQGYYTVLSDSELREVSACGELYAFEGFRNGKKVLSGKFQVKSDCCHVEKLSGPEQIVLK